MVFLSYHIFASHLEGFSLHEQHLLRYHCMIFVARRTFIPVHMPVKALAQHRQLEDGFSAHKGGKFDTLVAEEVRTDRREGHINFGASNHIFLLYDEQCYPTTSSAAT